MSVMGLFTFDYLMNIKYSETLFVLNYSYGNGNIANTENNIFKLYEKYIYYDKKLGHL